MGASDPDDIRRELAAMRLSLGQDVRAVVDDARTLSDWRHHFRRHPWIYCGSAAAVGFLLVPRKLARTAVAAGASYGALAAPLASAGARATIGSSAWGLAGSLFMKHAMPILAAKAQEILARRRQAASETSSPSYANETRDDDDQPYETQ